MALPVIDPTVGWVVVALALAAVIYYIYLEKKKPVSEKRIPAYRGRPRVVTKAGIFDVKETISLGANKYMVRYDDPGGYSQVYTTFPGFDELVDVYPHQSGLGQQAAVKIELDLALDIVYGHEETQTRKLLKKKLAQLTESLQNKMSDQKANQKLKELSEITRRLTEKPLLVERIGEQLAKETNTRLKAESDLLAERGNTEGRISKRVEPIERIAASRAKSRDDNSRTQRE